MIIELLNFLKFLNIVCCRKREEDGKQQKNNKHGFLKWGYGLDSDINDSSGLCFVAGVKIFTSIDSYD